MTPLEIRKQYFGTESDQVCLLGSAPASLRLAPYNNPKWAMCGCSPGVYGVAPHTEAWVELHRYEPGQSWFSPEYCQFLHNHQGPVWVAEKRPEIPNSVELPLLYLVQKYSPYFFTSSLAFMMAMAIEAGFKKIALFGVDMAAASEYKDQRLGCQYFAVIANMLGIEVGVPPESDLLRPAPLYGVSEISHPRIKIMARRRELEARINDALARQAAAKDESVFLRGAMDDLEWAEMDWFGNVDSTSSLFTSPPVATVFNDIGATSMQYVPPVKFDADEPDPAPEPIIQAGACSGRVHLLNPDESRPDPRRTDDLT